MSNENDDTENCEECGSNPVGVTMWEGMDGWSCPNCGHYNEFKEDDKESCTDGGYQEQ